MISTREGVGIRRIAPEMNIVDAISFSKGLMSMTRLPSIVATDI